MSYRPRVLVLTPRFPYPVVGGDRLRIFYICKELAQTCDVTLLSLCENRAEMDFELPSDAIFSRVERVLLPRWRSALNSLLALPTQIPLQIAYYRSSTYNKMVKSLAEKHDVCLAHLIRTGDYIASSRVPKLLEMTDAISLNYKRVKSSDSGRSWKAQIYGLEADRLLKYERRVIDDFDAVTLVSPVDKEFLLNGRNKPEVMVCSNGVDLSKFPYAERSVRERIIVFIGNMTTLQNTDACIYFIEEVLPALRQVGDFKFRIIGRMGASEASCLSKHEGVEVFANVDSVPNAIGNAYAAVAPMRLGAGVQNKILEYLSLGLPAVISSVGLEGLKAVPDHDLLIASTPSTWVAQLIYLWENADAARAISRAGHTYVEGMHSWKSHLAPLVDMVHKLASSPKRI